MKRKSVLILALVAAVGLGFGWLTEDLCCLGGSYADDPSTPIVAAQFALPSHSQAASKAVLPAVSVVSHAMVIVPIGTVAVAPKDTSSRFSSLQNPRRC